MIASLAFAIDPYKQFRNSPNNVARLTDGPQVVRYRRKIGIPAAERKLLYKNVSVSYSYANNPQGPLLSYIYTGPTRSVTSGVVNRPSQPVVYAHSWDTTRRTRRKGQNQGEFEHFTPSLRSPDRSFGYLNSDQLVYNSIGTGQRSSHLIHTHSRSIGPEFRCTDANIQAFLPVIRARALAKMQEHVYGMLDNLQPSHRTFDLVRQIAELKDLTQTLRGTLEIWRTFERFTGTNLFRDLQHIAGSWRNPDLMRYYARTLGHSTGFRFDPLLTIDQNAGSAFLTFKFGWESMLRGVEQFLPSPHRTARQINYLISRIGRDTSFRTKRTWTEPETSLPEFTAALLRNEAAYDGSTVKRSGVRNVELRCQANFNIRFPEVDIPRLRRQLYLRKLGAYPSASDVYNLIPWTWMADWFTGGGDYVSLMDSIANDTSLINYGFMTYREESDITASVRGRFTTNVSRTINGASNSYQRYQILEHEGRFKWIYHLRRSIPSLTNVRSYWDSNLNPNQTAIIGALISSKNGSRGRRVAS